MRWRETSRRRLASVWVAALGLVALAGVEGAHAEDAKPPFFTWGTQEIGLSLDYSIELGSRFVHISNAGTQSPNRGIDTVQVLAGFAYKF
jgi:hypothetical protein